MTSEKMNLMLQIMFLINGFNVNPISLEGIERKDGSLVVVGDDEDSIFIIDILKVEAGENEIY